MKTQVMKRAWDLAKEGVKTFGGKVKEYFQQALVIAWGEIKEVVKTVVCTLEDAATYLNEKGLYIYETKANIWEKHGLRRIYVTINGEKGYLQFDKNDKIEKTFIDAGYQYDIRDNLKAFADLYNSGYVYM